MKNQRTVVYVIVAVTLVVEMVVQALGAPSWVMGFFPLGAALVMFLFLIYRNKFGTLRTADEPELPARALEVCRKAGWTGDAALLAEPMPLLSVRSGRLYLSRELLRLLNDEELAAYVGFARQEQAQGWVGSAARTWGPWVLLFVVSVMLSWAFGLPWYSLVGLTYLGWYLIWLRRRSTMSNTRAIVVRFREAGGDVPLLLTTMLRVYTYVVELPAHRQTMASYRHMIADIAGAAGASPDELRRMGEAAGAAPELYGAAPVKSPLINRLFRNLLVWLALLVVSIVIALMLGRT